MSDEADSSKYWARTKKPKFRCNCGASLAEHPVCEACGIITTSGRPDCDYDEPLYQLQEYRGAHVCRSCQVNWKKQEILLGHEIALPQIKEGIQSNVKIRRFMAVYSELVTLSESLVVPDSAPARSGGISARPGSIARVSHASPGQPRNQKLEGERPKARKFDYLFVDCGLSAACLKCPYPRCRYNLPHGRSSRNLENKTKQIKALSRSGLASKTISKETAISLRTVQRILSRSTPSLGKKAKI